MKAIGPASRAAMNKISKEESSDDEPGFGTRALLALVSVAFGITIVMSAPQAMFSTGVYLLGSFFFSFALACITWGRVRQFIGSLIASTICGISLWFLLVETFGDPFFADRRTDPSVLNAVLIFVLLGVPCAIYVYKAGFGLRRNSPGETAPPDRKETTT